MSKVPIKMLAHLVSLDTVDQEVRNLNHEKDTTHKEISLLKSRLKSVLMCVGPLAQIFNDCIANSTFSRWAKVHRCHILSKNGPTNTRTNFRPISVLPTVSKLFERIMDKQIAAYIIPFLSSRLFGFRQGYIAQHAFVRLLEKF